MIVDISVARVSLPFASGAFGAFGSQRLVFGSSYSDLATSGDGQNWAILPSSAAINAQVAGYAYADGVGVVMVGQGTSTRVARTTDGVNWAAVTVPSGQRANVVRGNGVFLTGPSNYANVMRSTDYGVSWASYPVSGYSVAFTGVNFVTCSGFANDGSTPLTAHYSQDGMTWTNVLLPASTDSPSLFRVVYSILTDGNGTVLLIGADNDGVGSSYWRSTDHGVTWAVMYLPYPGNYQSCGRANGYFVVVGGQAIAGAVPIQYSNNGMSWQVLAPPVGDVVYAYVYMAVPNTSSTEMYVHAVLDVTYTHVYYRLGSAFWTGGRNCTETG